jgi:diacylglycerol kinase (ATP)
MTHNLNRQPVHLIINPHSGHGGHKQLLAHLRCSIRSAGIELVEYTTRAPGDATAYARSVLGQAGAIMVWGGDGTINEVAQATIGQVVPILPFPAGTENLLAKELRIPSRVDAVLRILQAGRVVHCDVGRVNDRNFLLIIGVGFDAEVVRRLSAIRSGHISHLSYFWPIWRTFWEHDFPRLRIVADGQELFNDFGLAFVGNISRYAVGLRVCRDARFDDGLLDLVVFSCREQTSLMLHAAWTLLRLHPLKGNVLYRRLKTCKIETSCPLACQLDGEIGPAAPLDISVEPRKLALLIAPNTQAGSLARQAGGFWPWKGD